MFTEFTRSRRSNEVSNHIEKTREEIERYFDPRAVVEGSALAEISPSAKFRLESISYRQKKPGCNWLVAKVQIFDTIAEECIFSFIVDDGHFFHAWLQVGKVEYLVCAENMCGGQTVIDLTNREFSSYADGTDGFIWADFFLALDGKTLATIGCVWACPYELVIYDFTKPLALPLTELKRQQLVGSETVAGWPDNESISTKRFDDSLQIERVIHFHR